jgi:hypothetical protein
MTTRYPLGAGTKSHDRISLDNVAAIDGDPDRLRRTKVAILLAVHHAGAASSDRINAAINGDRMYTRPRVTELKKLEMLRFSGIRVKGMFSAKSSNCYELTEDVAALIEALEHEGMTVEESMPAILTEFEVEYERRLEEATRDIAATITPGDVRKRRK